MNAKERLILTSIIAAQLGPLLDQWAIPKADQTVLLGWVIVAIPVLYHQAAEWLPRILNRFFPPVQPLEIK